MKPQDLIKEYGTAAEVGRRFGYTRAAIGLWVKREKIPYRAQLLIQAATMGKFHAVKVKP
jgi:hypothetical protein